MMMMMMIILLVTVIRSINHNNIIINKNNINNNNNTDIHSKRQHQIRTQHTNRIIFKKLQNIAHDDLIFQVRKNYCHFFSTETTRE